MMKHGSGMHKYACCALMVLRVVVGIIFIYHGVDKWELWNAVPSEQMTANTLTLMKFLSIVEPLGGAALILGFLTRWAALGLAIIMVGAIFYKINVLGLGFSSKTGTGWEFDLILLASNLVLIFSGPGCLALDSVWRKSKEGMGDSCGCGEGMCKCG